MMRRCAVLVLAAMLLVSVAAAQSGFNNDVTVERPLVRTAEFYFRADELTFHSGGGRITSVGRVEVGCDNRILTANRLVFDRVRNTLVADGDVVIRMPNGNVIRADRYAMHSKFRDAFEGSIKRAIADGQIKVAPRNQL